VLTGRQKPLTETVLLFVEVITEQGHEGMGFSYSKRAGGRAQYAHLAEIAETALGQDPSAAFTTPPAASCRPRSKR
jgi:L-alanine-DL-glutamate epimerase-like enolase superfamily enzyme